MSAFASLFAYNRWCNERLMAACLGAPGGVVATPIDGTFESVLRTAQHLLGVETVYLQMMSGEDPSEPGRQPVAETAAALAEIDARLEAFVAGLDDATLARRFTVPWFERDFAVADGLLQVITHSCEHRADIASALNRLGVETPPIDYIARLLD